ncbi:uncharacterized protein [Triticum aestivum]|uniref:uncharacterized protein n=1 Tax=Triticum aestivum TaxID=4565 RepID=UPI001D01F778|nr:uncharacterized protein LOC123136832 [Triticum aestivum]
MSSPSSLEEEASSSPEVQEHPSSTPMSPAAATPEVLKMSDEHPSSHPMLHVAATPEKEAEIGVLTVSDTKITTGGMAVSPTPRFWLPRSVNLTLLQDSHMGIALTRRPHACGA